VKRMGRPRLHDSTIPKHVDQAAIPKGAYWDSRDGVWYTILDQAGARRRRKLAGPEARLSDLHRLLEEVAGVQTGTLGWLCDHYHASTQYTVLADKSKVSYEEQLNILRTYKTKAGYLADLRLVSITSPFLQRVIDKIGAEYPSKANHLLRYVRRVFSWGMPRGRCTSNPAKGLEQAKERKRRRLPAHDVHNKIIEHARATRADYLWITIELAYLLLLRGIEVITLTDANADEDGVQTNRRKGSRDTLVLWSPRLRSAWAAGIERRKRIWGKKGIASPIRAAGRLLLVNAKGKAISRQALNTIWQNLMLDAIDKGVIAESERFGSHDLKRKGITDTKGNRADKREASGHRTDAMMDVYDLSLPHVTTPGDV
jgi:site-specific recombinase XerD